MKLIREIAKKVRQRLERLGEEDCSCKCAIGSAALTLLLRKLNVECRLVFGQFRMTMGSAKIIFWSDHCWVETDTHIIDITATQFGQFHKVLVLSKKSKNYSHYYKECKRSKPRPEPDARFWKRWARDQRPTSNLLDQLCA